MFLKCINFTRPDGTLGTKETNMHVASRRQVLLVGVGGIYGFGCKEVYRFHHTTYPYSSCICSFFTAASLLFVHFLYVFFVLVPVLFVITFYVLNIYFAQYKHTYGQRVSHGSHMKAAHT